MAENPYIDPSERERLLLAYSEEHLDREQRDRFDRVCRDDPEFARIAEQLRSDREQLTSLRGKRPPAEIMQNVRAAIPQAPCFAERSERGSPVANGPAAGGPFAFPTQRWLGRGAAAAVLILAAGLGHHLGYPPEPQDGTQHGPVVLTAPERVDDVAPYKRPPDDDAWAHPGFADRAMPQRRDLALQAPAEAAPSPAQEAAEAPPPAPQVEQDEPVGQAAQEPLRGDGRQQPQSTPEALARKRALQPLADTDRFEVEDAEDAARVASPAGRMLMEGDGLLPPDGADFHEYQAQRATALLQMQQHSRHEEAAQRLTLVMESRDAASARERLERWLERRGDEPAEPEQEIAEADDEVTIEYRSRAAPPMRSRPASVADMRADALGDEAAVTVVELDLSPAELRHLFDQIEPEKPLTIATGNVDPGQKVDEDAPMMAGADQRAAPTAPAAPEDMPQPQAEAAPAQADPADAGARGRDGAAAMADIASDDVEAEGRKAFAQTIRLTTGQWRQVLDRYIETLKGEPPAPDEHAPLRLQLLIVEEPSADLEHDSVPAEEPPDTKEE